jgi:hypothetical protein
MAFVLSGTVNTGGDPIGERGERVVREGGDQMRRQ